MAAEIAYAGLTGKTLKAQMAQATVITADIALVEVGTSGYYVGNASGAAGFYNVYITEGAIIVGAGTLNWNGTAEVKLPSVLPGAAGGLLIAGSNAATTFAGLTTGALATGTITTTGNFSISGTFDVAGVTTLAAVHTGTITTTGDWSVSGGFFVYGSVVYGAPGTFSIGSLFVTGSTTLSGSVTLGQVTASNAFNDIRGVTVGALATNVITAASMNADASTEIVTTLLATAVDGTTTVAESFRLQNSALGGKASGLAGLTAAYRDLADTKDRIVATVDADGNRTAVTRTLT